ATPGRLSVLGSRRIDHARDRSVRAGHHPQGDLLPEEGVNAGIARIRVLVVDDSAFMRRAIAKMLENEPTIVVAATARSGEEAVEKAAQIRPDVITMDVEMPGMGGLEAVREITSQHRIPIIMVSALTQEGAETTFRALELGAVDFVAKPDAAYDNINDVARDLVAKVLTFAQRPV